jgi:glycosyltransferase involved in cell wall biosynthesis
MPEEGVNVIGYVHDRSGLGEIARLLVEALGRSGVPHVVLPVGSKPLRDHLRSAAPRYNTNIVCVNAQMLPSLVEGAGRGLLRDRRTIGFWWWEVDPLPAVMGWASHLVDEIWVGSDHARTAIEPRVSKPVHVFPVPVIRPQVAHVTRREFGLPQDRFAFMFSFNFLSVFERKNPLGLVDAYSRAFAPGDGPILVVKTIGWERFPDELARLQAAAARRPDVFVIRQGLPYERYHGLVNACNAYASLHRAEGFGLTIAEAMALGKPAVATGYSGNLAFMTETNSYLVPATLAPVPERLEPYSAGSQWAEPDLDAASALLRRVVERPEEARAKAEEALVDFAEGHSLEGASEFVRRRLAAPRAAREVPTDPVERAAYELMWGPDLESARPWARRLRRSLRPLLRPYVDHQRRLTVLTLEALRDVQRHSKADGGPSPDANGKG